MGVGSRVFLVSGDNTVNRFSLQRFDQLHSEAKTQQAAEFAGQKIRYIQVLLKMVEGKPVKILHLECGFLRFDKDGRLDSDAGWDQMRLAVDMVESGWVADNPAALVNARHLFARREYDHKYRWKPSAAVLKRVGEAIFGGSAA